VKWFKIISAVVVISALFASCAYFNTFHNTKKLYKEAKQARKERQGENPSAPELKKYDETIEKASKILEVYPDSKYVDDALFILGECFYYKQDYVRAQRKFQELITYFPESDYFGRARLWLAKSNLRLEDYNSTKVILSDLLKSEKLDERVRTESQLLLGESLFSQQLYPEAEQEFKKAAETAKRDDNKAAAYLKLGECRIINENYEAAVRDFEKAIEYSPDSDFEFDARLNFARALKLAKQFHEAKRVCRELLDSEYYKDRHGEAQLELANCIYHEGRALYDRLKGADLEYRGKIEEAIDAYRVVTIEHKATEASARAYYQMGKIYLEEFGDFAQAKNNFELVSRESRDAKIAREATTLARDLDELIKLNNKVKRAQGEQLISGTRNRQSLTDLQMLLLEYGNHPELRFMETQASRAAAAANGTPQPATNGESEIEELVANKLQLAEVYLFQFAFVDSALHEYSEVLQLFPEHPAAAKALYSCAFIHENELHNKAKSDSLLELLVRRFPNTHQARQARAKLGLAAQRGKEDRASDMYQAAETQLFQWNEIKGALDRYRQVVETYPDSEYAPKSLYAMGWIHESLRADNEMATQIYRELQDKYPESRFASVVSKKLKALDKPDETTSSSSTATRLSDSAPELRETAQTPTVANRDSTLIEPKESSTPEKPQKDPPIVP